MALKRNEFWWIEKAGENLIDTGRYFCQGTLYDGGIPNLFGKKEYAKEFCRPGERPVKVRLVKVEE